ncbi:MAG: AraC family transcriptional regulator, partial [Clostridiales bacterium]|nr:AraC family transcriptional regulator [Clostridiales bacterium]
VKADLGYDIERLFKLSNLKKRLDEPWAKSPVLSVGMLNCFWFAMPAENGFYVLGPSLADVVSEETYLQFLNGRGPVSDEILTLGKELEKVPLIPLQTLFIFYRMYYHVVMGSPATISELASFALEEKASIYSEETILGIQERNFITLRKAELFLYECVAKGAPDKIKAFTIENSNADLELSSLADNEIRSFKNNMIISTALSGRAAIEGGLPVETVYPLTDMYILQLEDARDKSKLAEVNLTMMLDLATRVRDFRIKRKCSKPIEKCLGHIAANVRTPLKLSELAKIANMNPDSLSRKFKRETGIVLSDYIRSAKVDEAEIMLRYTSEPQAMISEYLGYSSQSQFIAAFKRVKGITPDAFRKNQQKGAK